MSKIGIIYMSYHHGNTKKVLDAMKEEREIDLIDIKDANNIDLSLYDKIGLASGIYFQDVSKLITNFVNNQEFGKDKEVFIIYTCGLKITNYAKKLEKLLIKKGCKHIGTFDCKGYDTFGPYKLIGGVAKNHPNEEDLMNARNFIKNI